MTLRDTLKDDWKDAWKWLQTQLGFMVAAIPEIYNYVESSPELMGSIPMPWFRHGMAFIGLLIMLNSIRKKNVAAA